MALRLITGRSGQGKTEYLVQESAFPWKIRSRNIM